MSGKTKVMLTAVGCPSGPTVIESLREQPDLFIVGTDRRAECPGRYLVDQFLQLPDGQSDEFIPTMMEVIEREGIEVLLPLATFGLDTLAHHKTDMERLGCRICVSDAEPMSIANNKRRLYEMFASDGIVPEYEAPSNIDSLVAGVHRLGYPDKTVVVKPEVGHGSIGVRFISQQVNRLDLLLHKVPTNLWTDLESLADILAEAKEFPPLVISEFLPGSEIGVDLFFEPTGNRLRSTFVRDNGVVVHSEISAARCISNAELTPLIAAVAQRLPLSYAANFDIRTDRQGRPKVMDVNPRLPASAYLAIRSGLNLPLMSIRSALGKDVDFPAARQNLKMYSYRGFIVVDESTESIVSRSLSSNK